MPKMHLYSMSGTCALSVHIVLEWIDAQFEVTVLKRGENREAAFQQINPRGEVPALVLEDGQVLTEAAAILGYLADRYPQSHLGLGMDLLPRYELSQLMSYLTSEVRVAFKPLFTPQRFLSDESQFAALRTHAFTVIMPMLALLDARLGSKRALLDSGRSILDPYMYVMLRWAEYVPGGLSAHRNLNRFRDEFEGDAGVLRALAQEG